MCLLLCSDPLQSTSHLTTMTKNAKYSHNSVSLEIKRMYKWVWGQDERHWNCDHLEEEKLAISLNYRLWVNTHILRCIPLNCHGIPPNFFIPLSLRPRADPKLITWPSTSRFSNKHLPRKSQPLHTAFPQRPLHHNKDGAVYLTWPKCRSQRRNQKKKSCHNKRWLYVLFTILASECIGWTWGEAQGLLRFGPCIPRRLEFTDICLSI